MPLITTGPPTGPWTSAQTPSGSAASSLGTPAGGREQSPEAPPASPLTPVLRAANTVTDAHNISAPVIPPPAHVTYPHPRLPPTTSHQNDTPSMPPVQLIDRPPPLPFSGDDSTDAIALRAAISSLQFQRAKAQKDLRTLEEIKRHAVEHPDDFRQHVLRTASKPAAGPASGAKWEPPQSDDESSSDAEEDAVAGAVAGAEKEDATWKLPESLLQNTNEIPDSQQTPSAVDSSFHSRSSPQHQSARESESRLQHSFPEIPGPQDVVRCPPIEWEKYHVLGEPLDKMHMEQQLRPGVSGAQGRDSVVAGPYNPFLDRLGSEESSSREQISGARKDSGASAAEQASQRRKSSKAFFGAE